MKKIFCIFIIIFNICSMYGCNNVMIKDQQKDSFTSVESIPTPQKKYDIENGSIIEGVLKKGKKRLYSFTTDKPALVGLDRTKKGSGNQQVYILDAEKNKACGMLYDYGYVTAGDYFFVIKGDGKKFKFKFELKKIEESFREDKSINDNKESRANSIEFNKKYYGAICDNDLVDYFKFKVEKNEYFVFNYEGMREVYISNEQGYEIVTEPNRTETKTVQRTLHLKAGNYILRVGDEDYGSEFSPGQSYYFSIKKKKPAQVDSKIEGTYSKTWIVEQENYDIDMWGEPTYWVTINEATDKKIRFQIGRMGAFADPYYISHIIDAKLENNKAQFEWSDGWMNSGKGSIELCGKYIKLKVDVLDESGSNRSTLSTDGEVWSIPKTSNSRKLEQVWG